MKKNLAILIVIFAVTAASGFGLRLVFAFTEPGGSPPSSNTEPPITTSSTGQSKAGGLNIATSSGTLGVGATASGTYKLEVVGGTLTGIYGSTSGTNTFGLAGIAGGSATGVSGSSVSGTGLYGSSTSGTGVSGLSASGSGGLFYSTGGNYGLYSAATSTSVLTYGGYFKSKSSTSGSAGAYAINTSATGSVYGLYAQVNSTNASSAAVYGRNTGGSGWAGYFEGPAKVTGNLTIDGTITVGGGGTVFGSGTTNYLSKWTASSSLGNSIIFDNGTNVGIGTTGPTGKLTVVGAASAGGATAKIVMPAATGGAGNYAGIVVGQALDSGGAVYLTMGGTDSGDSYYYHQNAGTLAATTGMKLMLRAGATDTGGITIATDGNVGIGTTSPGAELDVRGQLRVTRAGAGSGASAGQQVRFAGTASGQAISAAFTDGANSNGWFGYQDSATATNRHFWWSVDDGASKQMVLTQAGNLGIGTTSPAYKLDVQGTGTVASFNGPIIVGTPTSASHSATKSYVDSVIGGGGASGSFATLTVTGSTYLATTSGNVGIGTTSPTNQLHLYSTSGKGIIIENPNPNIDFKETDTTDKDWRMQIATGSLRIDQINDAGDAYITDGVLFLRDGGNIGIGDTVPEEKLTIVGGLKLADTNSRLYFGGNGGTSYRALEGNTAGTLLQIGEGYSQAALYGNVGIGTTSPAYKLDVAGTAYFSQPVIVGTPTSASHAATKSYVDSSITGNISGTANYISKFTGSNSLGNSVIYETGGNVGIGTTSPTGVFQVGTSAGGSGLNIITGGTASADSFYGAGYEASKSSDGNTGTRWASNGAALPHYWKYDLGVGVTKTVVKLRIYTYKTGDPNGAGLKDFSLQGSNNDSTYTVVYTGAAANIDDSWQEFTFTNSTAYRYYKINATSNYRPDNYITFYEVEMMEGAGGGGTKFIIDSAGNVGIGTTSPATKLHVVGGDYNSGIRIESSDVYGSGVGFKNTSAGGRHFNIFSTGSSNGEGAGKLAFQDNAVGTRMVIDSSGNVGIGTTSPSYKLDVNGNIRITGDLTVTGTLSYGSIGADWLNANYGVWSNGSLYMDVDNDNNGTEYFIVRNGADATTIQLDETGNLQIRSTIYPGTGTALQSSYGIWQTGSGLRTQGDFYADGNVGIGTTAPGAKLHVYGASPVFQIEGSGTTNAYLRVKDAANFWTMRNYGTDGRFVIEDSTLERLTITNTGNVGIGTTSPARTLDVVGTAGTTMRLQSSGITQLDMVSTGASGRIFSVQSRDTTGSFRINDDTAGQNRLTIDSSGNVGIGTTAPGAKLHVEDNSANPSILIKSTGNYYTSLIGNSNRTGSGSGLLNLLAQWNSTNVAQILLSSADDTVNKDDGQIFFKTSASGGTLEDRMTILNNGNVGIGTTSPAYKLDVNGNANITGNLNVTGTITGTLAGTVTVTAGNVSSGQFGANTGGGNFSFPGNVGIGTTGPNNPLDILGSGNQLIDITSSDNDDAFIKFTNQGSENVFAGNDNGDFSVRTGGSGNWLTVQKTSGNVGIGTTSPSEKLHVAGNARITGNLQVDGTFNLAQATYNQTSTATSGSVYNLSTSLTGNPATASSAIYYNSLNQLFTQSGNTQNFTGYLYSGYYQAQHVGTGTVSNLYGLQISYNNTSTGVVSNAVGLRISSANSGGGSVTANYGLLIDDLAGTSAAAIYQSGSNDINYFAGNVGIGTTGPNRPLDVEGAGDTYISANAPSGATAGLLMGTPTADYRGRIQYVTATDMLSLWTANTQRLTIDNIGNVGIGTTSPGTRLDISGGNMQILGNGKLYFPRSDGSQTAYIYNSLVGSSGSLLEIRGDGSATGDIAIMPGRNVGIGTTGPTAKLETTSGDVRDGIEITAGYPFLKLMNTNVNANARNWALTHSIAEQGDFAVMQSDAKDGDPVTAGTSRLYFERSGNVGIGTTSPAYKLDVQGGQVNASGGLCIAGDCRASWGAVGGGYWTASGANIYNNNAGNVGIGTTSPATLLHLEGASPVLTIKQNNTSSGAVEFRNSSNTIVGMLKYDTVGGNTLSIINRNAGPIIFSPNEAEAMRIISTGDVGIGYTSTSGYKLAVSGTIYASDSISSASSLVAGRDSNAYHFKAYDGATLIGAIYSDSTRFAIQEFSGTRGLNLFNSAGNGLTVATSGNVGIGTTSPDPGAQLEIAKSGAHGIFLRDTSVGGATWQIDNARQAQGVFSITESGVGRRLVIMNGTGNVGIGTTSPGNLLHVRGDATNLAVFEDASSGSKLAFKLDTPAGTGSTISSQIDSVDPRDLLFRVQQSGGSGLDAVAIKSTGNVGIGTTSPGSLLSLSRSADNADIRITEYQNNNYGPTLFFQQARGTQSSPAIMQANDTITLIRSMGYDGAGFLDVGNITFAVDGTPGTNDMPGRIMFYTTPDGASAVVERVRIDNQGNVGIGTTSPSYKLDVNGNTRITGNLNVTGTITGTLAGTVTVTAGNVSSGQFGANTGGGDFYFPAKLGIGTTSPGAFLHLKDESGTAIRFEDTTDGVFGEIGNGVQQLGTGTIDYLAVMGNAGLYLGTGSTAHMTINGSTGNVGIGTTGPNSPLHVVQTSTSGSTVRIFRDLASASTDDVVFQVVQENAGDDQAAFYVRQDGTGYIMQLKDAATDVFTVIDGGNVGIGTTSPAYKLDVNGNTNITGNLNVTGTITGTLAGTVTVTAGNVSSGQFGANTGGGIFSFPGNVGIGTTAPGYLLHLSSASGTDLALTATTGTARTFRILTDESHRLDIFDQTAGAYRMSITTAGNVGIGTTSPVVKLQITAPSGSTENTFFTTNDFVNGSVGSVLKLDFGAASGNTYTRLSANSAGATAWNNLILQSGGGNVGIGTTSPTVKLDVNGSARISGTLDMSGNNVSGVNKLTVTTIDPEYTFDGKKYATYVASFAGGVKEETTGKVKLTTYNKQQTTYEYTIDFDKIDEGSDLWLWRKVIDFSKDNVEVLATPYGELAMIAYQIDGNKIIFKSDKAVEISYRLTGRRNDWKLWPTQLGK